MLAYDLQHLLVICCHGGLPIVNLGQTPPRSGSYQYKHHDLTSWVATEKSATILNGADSALREILPNTRLPTDLTSCQLFNLTFTDASYAQAYAEQEGSLGCRCPAGWGGASCELRAGAYAASVGDGGGDGDGGNASSRLLLWIVGVPLCLVVLAVTATFVKRVCCDDCWSPFCSKRPPGADSEPLDQAAIERCLNSVRAWQSRRDGGGDERPAQAAPCLPPPAYVDRGSPPPSYRSQPPSPTLVSPPPRHITAV